MGGLTTRQLTGRNSQQARTGRQDQLQPGDMLQDRYRIVGVLGVGGFSSVYQARDMRFASVTRLCAVKEMLNQAADPEVRSLATESFVREANILATFDHPAIPEVYDYFTEGDRSYLVIEFIRGKDLEAMLAEVTDFLPQEKVLNWALQLCDVLAYLHSHKPRPMVFRDLKPSNIMLDPHGRIRLIDFGIAKVFQSGERGTMIGTEGYSPPEQYRGEGSPAGDVYALGATLHHILTRQDPRLETPFTFQERPVRTSNPNVSPTLEAIIMRCVAYNAADRYPDALTVREALLALTESGAAPATGAYGSAPAHFAFDAHQAENGATAVAPATAASTYPARSSRGEGSVQPLWTFVCEDEIRSGPAVADGTVYVGAYDNNLYAVSADSGEFLWKFPAKDGIASSPVVYKSAVLVGSADGCLYSIKRMSGRSNWKFNAGGAIYSSPRVHLDHIFFGADDNYLYTVNVTSGRLAWKTHAHSPVRSSACFGEDRIFFGTEAGYVFAIDLQGQIKWQFQARRAVTSTPALVDDMLFVGSMDGTIYALDAGSGWAIWRMRTKRPIISSPVVHDDAVYIGSSDGHLYAINRNSGQKLWAFETDGQVTGSPVVWNSAIYFGCTDGFVYSLDLNRGKLRWRFETDGFVVSTPAIARDILYIGSADHRLYALPV